MPVADRLCESIEDRYPPAVPAQVAQADAILVLGGGISGAMPPRAIAQLSVGGSRAWYGARLWKTGKAPLMVAVGGGRGGFPESAAIAEFLIDLGIPRSAILEESVSRTTVQNALLVKALLEKHQIRRSLLVTSALHMPRALAIFRAAGVDVIPASADVEVVREREYGLRDYLPSAEALYRTSRTIKEIVGLWIYPVQLWLADAPAGPKPASKPPSEPAAITDGHPPAEANQDPPAIAPSPTPPATARSPAA